MEQATSGIVAQRPRLIQTWALLALDLRNQFGQGRNQPWLAGLGSMCGVWRKKPAAVKRKQADTTTPPTAGMADPNDVDRRESGRQIKRVTKDLPDYQPQHASKTKGRLSESLKVGNSRGWLDFSFLG